MVEEVGVCCCWRESQVARGLARPEVAGAVLPLAQGWPAISRVNSLRGGGRLYSSEDLLVELHRILASCKMQRRRWVARLLTHTMHPSLHLLLWRPTLTSLDPCAATEY